jgi:hypothetical protein
METESVTMPSTTAAIVKCGATAFINAGILLQLRQYVA